jgi:hypothetical protein
MSTALVVRTSTNALLDELLLRPINPVGQPGERAGTELNVILPAPGGMRFKNLGEDSTEQGQEPRPKISPFIPLDRNPPPLRRFELLQAFEATVLEVSADSFWAELHDLSNPSNPPETVELPLSEISKPDQSLLQPGSIFYWSIGYETSPTGQIRRISEIRLRRTPEWSQQTLDSMLARAAKWSKRFSDNGADNPTTGE